MNADEIWNMKIWNNLWKLSEIWLACAVISSETRQEGSCACSVWMCGWALYSAGSAPFFKCSCRQITTHYAQPCTMPSCQRKSFFICTNLLGILIFIWASIIQREHWIIRNYFQRREDVCAEPAHDLSVDACLCVTLCHSFIVFTTFY